MKDIELKLLSELMKDSRRSDRELAKAIGTSQPTVSRMISRLEKEGAIKEYTMIPDFSKVGFEIVALTFVKFEQPPTAEKLEELRRIAHRLEKEAFIPTIMAMSGMGLGYDRIIVSFHKDYSSYVQFVKMSKQLSTHGISKMDSFVINLHDRGHYQSLTFTALAKFLLTLQKKE
jgi:DNA-binding Lrp family transcriptional regulator